MSEPESVEATQSPSKARPARRGISPARIVLWVVFAGIFAGLFLEWRAKSTRDATLANIEKAYAPIRSLEAGAAKGANQNQALYEADVQKLVLGSPVYVKGEEKKATREDTYTWKFLLKPHGIKVQYGAKGRNDNQRELMDYETF